MNKSLPERIDEEILKFLYGDNFDKEPYKFSSYSNSFQQHFQQEYPEEYETICKRCMEDGKSK